MTDTPAKSLVPAYDKKALEAQEDVRLAIYASRASRGAFDLLALRGAVQLAIQVKRSALPVAFKPAEWQRMVADARRFGWRWTIAAVAAEGTIHFLDPAKARRTKGVRLGAGAAIDNLVAWIDPAR